MAHFERRYGQGHRLLQNAAEPAPANDAAPANMVAPRAAPAQTAQAAVQARQLPPGVAPHNYHETIARSKPVDLDHLAFDPGRRGHEIPRFRCDDEVFPEDIALPYDELVRRGLAEPRAAPDNQPPDPARRAAPAPAADPKPAPPEVQPAAPPPRPAQNNELVPAPARPGPVVNANAPVANLRHAPQPQIALVNSTVNVGRQNGAVGMPFEHFGIPFMPFNNFNPFKLANTMNFGQFDPYSAKWLDEDAEAKQLFEAATKTLDEKRAEHGYDPAWVAHCQQRVHKIANRDGVGEAKKLLRDMAGFLARWEEKRRGWRPVDLGGIGGGYGLGMGMGFGGGFGNM